MLDCWSPEIDKMMMNIIIMIFIMIFMIHPLPLTRIFRKFLSGFTSFIKLFCVGVLFKE